MQNNRYELNKQLAQMLAAVILISGALIDGKHAGLSVFRLPAFLNALGFYMKFFHNIWLPFLL